MNVVLSILFGLVVALFSFGLGPFWIPTVVLYVLARIWLSRRARKLAVIIMSATTFGLWLRCVWGWAWRSAIIFLIPFGILAIMSGGNDPQQMGLALAKVIVGWIMVGLFSLDAPIWPLRQVSKAGGMTPTNDVYNQIAEEFRTNTCDQGLLLKSLATAGGDRDKATALYTKERANILAGERARAAHTPSQPIDAATWVIAGIAVVLLVVCAWSALTGSGKISIADALQKYSAPSNTPQITPLAGTTSSVASSLATNAPVDPFTGLATVDLYATGLNYEKGTNGIQQDDVQALQWYQKAATAGNTNAMVKIGQFYATGKGGLKQDKDQEWAWYQKAAGLGDAQAMTEIGVVYQNQAQDFPHAMEWYQKAASAGNADAEYLIGYNYENGYGVGKDQSVAVTWYRQAEEKGSTDATRALRRLGFDQ